jgi:hypothetical protein
MGVYREYKSSQDPKKFLERFSKNINPAQTYSEETVPIKPPEEKPQYEIPIFKSMDYENLKKKCQEFLLGIISDGDFESIIELEKSKLEKFSKNFENFGFKSKNLSWERELQIKNMFLKAITEYDKGLEYLIDYTISRKKSSINSALQLITSSGEKLGYIKTLSVKETKDILEELKKFGDTKTEEHCEIKNESPSLPVPPENKTSTDLDILSQSPMFTGLSMEDLKEVILYTRACNFSKDDIFYNEGMEVDRIYIIIKGSVILYKELSSGGEEIILHMDKGDCLGDMGVIDGGPHSTNARIVSDKAKLLYISREDFSRLLNKYPRISMNLNRVYCYRMRDALNKISIT